MTPANSALWLWSKMSAPTSQINAEMILRFVSRPDVASGLEIAARASGYRLDATDAERSAQILSEICDALDIREEADLSHELISFALVGSRFVAEVYRGALLYGGSAPHLLTVLLLGQNADRIQATGKPELFEKAGPRMHTAILRAREVISRPGSLS